MAQYNVGIMYSKGLGAPQDYAEAMAGIAGLRTRDSARPVMRSASSRNGQGVAQDYGKAMNVRATAEGFWPARSDVVAIHCKGQGG